MQPVHGHHGLNTRSRPISTSRKSEYLISIAKPAWGYDAFLRNPQEMEILKEADVVIVDLVANSQGYKAAQLEEYMTVVDAFLSHLHQLHLQSDNKFAILFVETFRTCAFSQSDCNDHCPSGQQGYMMSEIAGPPRSYSWCNRWWYMADLEMPVIKHYEVPVVHYRDAVWSKMSQPKPLSPCYWNGLSHPDAVAHELVASLVANGLAHAIHRSEELASVDCPSVPSLPPSFHSKLQTSRFCGSEPGTTMRMRASRPDTFQPVGNTGWELREDVPDKPGWLFETTNSDADPSSSDMATIWFRLKFSALPQLEVTYLKIYEYIGQARM